MLFTTVEGSIGECRNRRDVNTLAGFDVLAAKAIDCVCKIDCTWLQWYDFQVIAILSLLL